MNDVTIYHYGDRDIQGVVTAAGVALSDEQIGLALGYAEPRKSIGRLVSRNADELKDLSTVVSLTLVESGREVQRSVRVWGEQGVMAITFLAKTDTAVAFRKWARETLYVAQSAALVRNPINEVDRMAGLMNQMLPALAGNITEVRERLAAVEERQKEIDPQAIEARMAYLEECKTLLVFGTKDKPQAISFPVYWRALKALIDINSFTNRAALTVPMMDRCIAYAQEWCRSRGIEPPAAKFQQEKAA